MCCKDNAIKPLQLILNKAIRFVFNLTKRNHITPYLKQLHILPIKFRIKFKVCLIAYRILNKTAPTYLIEKYPTFQPTTTINLRTGCGRDTKMFAIEKHASQRETIDDKIKIEWNKLPPEIRNQTSLTTLKTKLKEHFFIQAFNINPN